MYLESKIALKHNDPSTPAGTKTEIVLGALANVTRSRTDYLGANYVYSNAEGKAFLQNAFELKTEAEILALNDAIKGDLPIYEETPEPEFEQLKYYLAFRFQMVQSFLPLNPELTIDDIEIKTD